VERRRRDYENAFLNVDDYVLDAQIVLTRVGGVLQQIGSTLTYPVARRSLSEMKNCELPETMLRVEMERRCCLDGCAY
jgi:hypothetical protein